MFLYYTCAYQEESINLQDDTKKVDGKGRSIIKLKINICYFSFFFNTLI